MRRALVLLATITALMPVIAFAQDESATPSASPVASPAASDIGRTVRWGDWTIVVESAEFADTVVPDSGIGETARGKFLVVRFVLTNTGMAPQSSPYMGMTVRDDQGRTFDLDYSATSSVMIAEEDLIPGADGLQPDIPYPYTWVFDVALDAVGFTLILPGDDPVTIVLGI